VDNLRYPMTWLFQIRLFTFCYRYSKCSFIVKFNSELALSMSLDVQCSRRHSGSILSGNLRQSDRYRATDSGVRRRGIHYQSPCLRLLPNLRDVDNGLGDHDHHDNSRHDNIIGWYHVNGTSDDGSCNIDDR